MTAYRRRAAQALALVAAAAVFLPWQSGTENDGGSLAGNGVSEGRVVLVVCVATVLLVQIGWRPAWIGAGFVFAVTARAILTLSGGDPPDTAVGIWITAAAALAAVVLLAWDLFVSVAPLHDDAPGTDDKPQRNWLSGPLGRRRR